MEKLTKIAWRIITGTQWWSGTDTKIQLEIYRDGTRLLLANLEPGRTSRLNRGENATYFWEFKDPSGLGTAVSGTVVPYYIEFPNGLSGHLKVKLIATGDDAWEKISIKSTAFTGDLKWVPGTIDSVYWEEQQKEFYFEQDVVLSTDTSEGHPNWTLLY